MAKAAETPQRKYLLGVLDVLGVLRGFFRFVISSAVSSYS